MAERGILLYGGTFDPIHHGHLIVARAAAEQLRLETVILIPSARPPHNETPPVTPASHRMAMTRLAIRGESLFEVSDCEMNRQGPSYTLETVREFQKRFGPVVPLYWLIGADTLSDLPNWYKISLLAEECTLVTAARPGFDRIDWNPLQSVLSPAQIQRMQTHILDTPRIDISATEIRNRVVKGASIQYLVPPAVKTYIEEYSLYRPDPAQ